MAQSAQSMLQCRKQQSLSKADVVANSRRVRLIALAEAVHVFAATNQLAHLESTTWSTVPHPCRD